MSGLRRRLSSFKPLTSSPVSDMRVVHGEEEEHGGKECECDGFSPDEAYNENMLHSFSSISSHSSRSAEDACTFEGPPVELAGRDVDVNAPPVSSAPETSSKPVSSNKIHKDLPRVSTNTNRSSSTRAQRRGSTSPRVMRQTQTRDTTSSSSSSWLGYDLSIIVALVSPIGNLLTGSDHIKNILLLLLLIYYLHQLVEGDNL